MINAFTHVKIITILYYDFLIFASTSFFAHWHRTTTNNKSKQWLREKQRKKKNNKKSDGKWHDRQTVATFSQLCVRHLCGNWSFCDSFFFLSFSFFIVFLSLTIYIRFVFVSFSFSFCWCDDAVTLSDAYQYRGNFPGALTGPRQRLKWTTWNNM